MSSASTFEEAARAGRRHEAGSSVGNAHPDGDGAHGDRRAGTAPGRAKVGASAFQGTQSGRLNRRSSGGSCSQHEFPGCSRPRSPSAPGRVGRGWGGGGASRVRTDGSGGKTSAGRKAPPAGAGAWAGLAVTLPHRRPSWSPTAPHSLSRARGTCSSITWPFLSPG